MSDMFNPFETASDLVQTLRDEIDELRCGLAQERDERVRAIKKLKGAYAETRRLEAAKAKQFQSQEDPYDSYEKRLANFEQSLIDIRRQSIDMIEDLHSKIEMEIDHREAACCMIDKALIAEFSHVQKLHQAVAADIRDHKAKAETFFTSTDQSHEKLRLEVDDLYSLLRKGSIHCEPHTDCDAQPARQACMRSSKNSAVVASFIASAGTPSSPALTRSQVQIDNPQCGEEVLPEFEVIEIETSNGSLFFEV